MGILDRHNRWRGSMYTYREVHRGRLMGEFMICYSHECLNAISL